MKKPLLFVFVLALLTAWGLIAVPGFSSYLMMGGLISALVIAHEFGHFWVARKVGVKVERFGFGLPFGPTLFQTEWRGTKYCVHPVLLGGYVSFPDDNEDSTVPTDSPERFENKRIRDRAAIAIAGVVVNFILGYAILAGVFAYWGYPEGFPNTLMTKVDKIMDASGPAAKAGLQPGDIIASVAGKPVEDFMGLGETLAQYKNKPVEMTLLRDKQALDVTITPNGDGKILIQQKFTRKFVPLSGPIEVLAKTHAFLWDNMAKNFAAMGEIFSGKRSMKDLSGPVGIIKLGGGSIEFAGLSEGLILTSLISTLLAIMNILPVPMLDGGHLLFMAIEKLKGSPLKKEIQERFVQVSFVVLMGLMVLVLWQDVNTHILGR